MLSRKPKFFVFRPELCPYSQKPLLTNFTYLLVLTWTGICGSAAFIPFKDVAEFEHLKRVSANTAQHCLRTALNYSSHLWKAV